MTSYFDLQRIFGKGILENLANGNKDFAFLKSQQKLPNKSLYQFYNSTYNELSLNYRNDFIYRNIITIKLFLSRHSLDKSILINELRIGKSKADLVILNGSSTAYEIKSDVDNFEKLEKQLKSYLSVFDQTYVVIPESKLIKIGLIPYKVGIICLTINNTLKVFRKAISNKHNVKPEIIFNTLRIDEYKELVRKHFKIIPNVPNTKIYYECKKLVCSLPPVIVHKDFIDILKKRKNYSKYLKEHIIDYPDFLKYCILNYNFEDTQLKELRKYFTKEE